MHFYLRGWHRGFDPIWHGSETAVYGEPDVVIGIDQAMIDANMYHTTVEKVPMYMQHGGRYIPTGDYKLGIFNDGPEPLIFNRVVGDRYEPMQNARLAELLEGLNKYWPIEGTMMLKNGEITVVQLKIDEYAPGGYEQEKHIAYLVVAIDYTQGGLLWLRSDIRVVCWNTYSASIDTLEKIRIPNSKNADDTLAFIAKVQELTVEEQVEHVRKLNLLFERKVNTEEAATIVDAAFKDPKESSRMKVAQLDAAQKVGGQLAENFFELVNQDEGRYAWAQTRTQKLRAAVGNEKAKFDQQFPYAADTAYAWFQAVTATIDHSPLFTGSNDKRAVSRMLGNQKNHKIGAFNAALNLVGEGKKKSRKR